MVQKKKVKKNNLSQMMNQDDFQGGRPLEEDLGDPRFNGDGKNSRRKMRRIARSATGVGNLMSPSEGTVASRNTILDDDSEVSWGLDDAGAAPAMTAIAVAARGETAGGHSALEACATPRTTNPTPKAAPKPAPSSSSRSST